jgi:hypothetical protein
MTSLRRSGNHRHRKGIPAPGELFRTTASNTLFAGVPEDLDRNRVARSPTPASKEYPVAPPDDVDLEPAGLITSARQFRRFALTVAVIGVLLQFGLSSYFLEVGHAPRPQNVPVGLIGTAQQSQPVAEILQRQGGFDISSFADVDQLSTAVKERRSLGGLDVSGTTPHLYLSTAAGPTAANFMRTAFTSAIQDGTTKQVSTLVASGRPVPAATVAALTQPPTITDLAPLPASDKYGSALGFLVQALALGGTIASAGLGVLIPRTRRSARRGLGHLATLVVYAAGSAAAVLISMALFNVGENASRVTLFAEFFLVSLAITGSIAAAVALIGPAGMSLGLIYFGVGTVISGASIPAEFLPGLARHIGQALPTGAGAHAVRDSLYFPDAPIAGPLLVLTTYGVLGCLILFVTNVRANPRERTSELPSPLPAVPSTDPERDAD